MKKILFLDGCLVAMLALSGCVSARETQNPQPRKAVLCSEWEESDGSQIGDKKESREPEKGTRKGKSGKGKKKSRSSRNK